jgi:pyruvate dehydrogenase E1 component beta subunit
MCRKLDDFVLPIGKARIHKQGKDVTIVSFGIGMSYASRRSTSWPAGHRCRTDRPAHHPADGPADRDRKREEDRSLVTVEEGFPQSSIGTEIATRVQQQAFDYLDAPIITIAGKDVPMPYAANLEKLALPNVGEIVEAVKAVTYTA